MHKVWVALSAVLLLVTGCNIQKNPEGTSAPAPTVTPAPSPSAIVRKDLSGNVITTLYAEGVFIKTENGMLYMKENETEKSFRLSSRAEKDISVLSITEGTKVIVNYNGVSEGEVAEAISVEKLL